MARNRRFAQLELELGDVLGAGKDLPWGGRSTRGLTRIAVALRLATEGMGRLDLDGSHVGEINQPQLELELGFPSIRSSHGT